MLALDLDLCGLLLDLVGLGFLLEFDIATASARLGPGFYIKSTDTKLMLRKDRLFDFVEVTQRGEGGSTFKFNIGHLESHLPWRF